MNSVKRRFHKSKTTRMGGGIVFGGEIYLWGKKGDRRDCGEKDSPTRKKGEPKK